MKKLSIAIFPVAVLGCSMLLAAPAQSAVFARSAVCAASDDGGEGGSEPDDDKPTEPTPTPPVKPSANA